MLHHCTSTWNPGATAEQGRQLLAEPADPRTGATIRSSYPFLGGEAGVVLIEADDPEQLRAYLVPSFGAIHWDVRAVTAGD